MEQPAKVGRAVEQGPGVRMARVAEDLPARPFLHNSAEVHDRDPVGKETDGREVVGDV